MLFVMKTCLLLVCAWFAAATCCVAQSPAVKVPPVAPTFKDVPYGTHERHVLDLWQAKLPAGSASSPLVIFIHGGGWHGGDKVDVPARLLTTMLDHGVSVASINYRFTRMAILPAPQVDAARAVQFLRSKALEWRLDADHFAAYGISAGGCSSLWLAMHDDVADPRAVDAVLRHSSRLQAAVGMSPQTSLEPDVVVGWVGEKVLEHAMISRAVGAANLTDMKTPGEEWIRLLREASPIRHVSAGDPPVLISNPAMDPLPATTPGSAIHHALFGQKFKEAADAVGVTCVLRLESAPARGVPTPEEFLLRCLKVR